MNLFFEKITAEQVVVDFFIQYTFNAPLTEVDCLVYFFIENRKIVLAFIVLPFHSVGVFRPGEVTLQAPFNARNGYLRIQLFYTVVDGGGAGKHLVSR